MGFVESEYTKWPELQSTEYQISVILEMVFDGEAINKKRSGNFTDLYIQKINFVNSKLCVEITNYSYL
jgi:hypothetical protein